MPLYMLHKNMRVKHSNSHCDFVRGGGAWHYRAMNIAHLRKLRGLTQTDLAAMTKMTQPTISRAERGDDGVTLGMFKAIAAALEVPLYDLFTDGRSKPEAELLHAFRAISPDRQRGWLDLARSVIAEGASERRDTD
ncbi:helix-turn-helix domain-containing protein [Cereibacter sphaeroides]|uniref:helix-turn-helix domain-containing protein n=1 Tax=Cereibacter sphaeroides TaxID=1063 RepID=UPI0005A0DED5|nr:helix-turn-helix transcriptional regulator [Cereibacter sphaeroides]